MPVVVRFEALPEYAGERISEVYGPFEFVQLTYDALRISPDGDVLAYFDVTMGWKIVEELAKNEDAGCEWTDVIIYQQEGK